MKAGNGGGALGLTSRFKPAYPTREKQNVEKIETPRTPEGIIIIYIITLVVLLISVMLPFPALAGKLGEGDSCLADRKECSVHAVRAKNGGIKIDGTLDEPYWKVAPPVTDFIQHEPHDGEPATERTTVRVVYDDHAIYVGVTAHDREPHLIEGRLTRRDNECPSDWIHVAFDSYNDNRTAFEFAVNPAGVKMDALWFNDIDRDMNWDAVWDVSTSIDSDGWTAEFEIPFNQLRYANNGYNEWGFQVARQIHRRNETSFWSHTPRNANRLVSLFGCLTGIENIPQSSRLELLPYTVGSVEFFGDTEDDPFRSETGFEGRLGADIKYGLTSNITLDMAINPDFGQVEQDPSEFNLTAYETYFAEKRPFFIEGSNIFQYRLMFGDNDTERLFYSRRIGRSPQFYPLDSKRWEDTDDFYEETPQFTTIIGAAKVTGRTSKGWSIGIIEALTDEEEATVELPTGERVGTAVEPMTNYFVGRAMRDFNDGRSTVGGIITSVHRNLPNEDFDYMNGSAYSGGIDLSHRWKDDTYSIDLRIMGSHIRGSEEAMIEAQTSSARYYQRPDAHHLGVDSSLTHMNGAAANLWTGKFAGRWRFGFGYITRSPGFEVNDIGYMRDSDLHLVAFWTGLRQSEQVKRFREWNINFNIWDGWNYGGERFAFGGNVNGYVQFLNYWGCYGGINLDEERQDNGHLRGGPALTVPGYISTWYGFHTNWRKAVSFEYNGNYYRNDEGFGTVYISPGITIRPSGRFDMSVYPSYTISEDDIQYVDEIDGHYILGHLDMRVLSVTTRLNYTVTRDMSLQFYGMPFIAAGTYTNFREVVEPRAERYEDRFAPYDYSEYENPDFNFKQFRSNLVFRWEFNPGSVIYLVWSRGATDYEEEYGKFSLGRDAKRLFSTAGDNTFLVKINKWFSI